MGTTFETLHLVPWLPLSLRFPSCFGGAGVKHPQQLSIHVSWFKKGKQWQICFSMPFVTSLLYTAFIHLNVLNKWISETKPHLIINSESLLRIHCLIEEMFIPLLVFLSEQPSTCPTRQWLPAGSPGWDCPAAPHPTAGERPRQSHRAARLQPRPGAQQRWAAPVRRGGQRRRDGRPGTEPGRHLQLGGAKRRPGPLQAPAWQSQVSAGVASTSLPLGSANSHIFPAATGKFPSIFTFLQTSAVNVRCRFLRSSVLNADADIHQWHSENPLFNKKNECFLHP